MRAGLLDLIRQPGAGNAHMEGVPWAADNGCFNAKWVEGDWLDWLDKQPRNAMWAAVPDVVGDHWATMTRWDRYSPMVTDLGFKTAFVAQDGCDPEDIPDADCVFLGGSTEFKLSEDARLIVVEAQRRGMATHMGRVNSLRRLLLAAEWGVDTCDGTHLAFRPDQYLEEVLGWLEYVRDQPFLITR